MNQDISWNPKKRGVLQWEPCSLEGRVFGGLRWSPPEGVSPRGQVLLFHEFDGLGPESLHLIRQWGRRGWGGVAADLYGLQVRPLGRGESSLRARALRECPGPLRSRIRGWWDHVLALPGFSPERTLLCGSSFGGHGVIQGLQAGLRPLGAVSLYGYLDPPAPGASWGSPLLALLAGRDEVVPLPGAQAFLQAWSEGGFPGRAVLLPDAAHGFLRPGGGPPERLWAEQAWREVDRFLEDLPFAEVGER